MKIVFFGTSEFGAIILERLVQTNLRPVLAVTNPDQLEGRKQMLTPPPVKSLIMNHKTWNIPIAQPEKLDSGFILHVSGFKPDLIVLAAYGRIIPKEILDIPTHGALNVHPSLLPKHRGPSPIQTTILNGDEKTGVTLILMDEQIDHGPIVANSKSPPDFAWTKSRRAGEIRNPKLTYPELHKQLAELGAQLLVKTIPLWVEGKIKPAPQNHSEATYTKLITKEQGRIDWKKDAEYIERQVRAFDPWPGTFTYIKSTPSSDGVPSRMTGQILKILKADVIKNMQGEAGKTFHTEDGKLAVYTGKDALLIEELQLEGGKPMSSKEFLLGHKDIIGITLQ